MNIKALAGVVVLLVIAGGVWWAYTHGMGSTAGPQLVEASDYTEEAQYSTIEVKYPAAPAQARAVIEAKMDALIADFKKNIEGLDETVLPSLAGHKLAFVAEYRAYSSTTTVSYWYTVYEDTGGAHPNTYFQTFVFDQDSNELTLADMLKNNPNWLEELSLLVSNDVVAQYKDRAQVSDTTGLIYAEGLAPKEENFQNWFIDGETLVVELPPYQVAAYAVGSFEVRILLSDINH